MLSIVIPTYNRGIHLEKLCCLLDPYLRDGVEAYEIIFVDDGCGDGTADILKELCIQYPKVRAIVLDGNFGQQNATLAGIRHAQYDYVMTMDDDLRYGIKGIGQLIEAMGQGYDVVYGIPIESKVYDVRRLGTGLKEMAFRLFCQKPKGLKLTSFRLMNPGVVQYVKADTCSKVYLSARILQMTKNIHNVQVDTDESFSLPSNYSVWKLVRVLVYVIKNYTLFRRVMPKRDQVAQYIIREIYG